MVTVRFFFELLTHDMKYPRLGDVMVSYPSIDMKYPRLGDVMVSYPSIISYPRLGDVMVS